MVASSHLASPPLLLLNYLLLIILALKAFQNRRQTLAYWQSILMIVGVTIYTYYYYIWPI